MTIQILEVEQGTPEWREARTDLLTGSRIGAALGVSPWQSKDNLIREMVLENIGTYGDVDSPAMKWGRDNEDKARALAELETGLDFSDQRMRVASLGGFGYSPDGVSADGNVLLEIKCPYSLRDDDDPEFTPLLDQKHYMHQIQLGMMLTGCVRCVFIQWAPKGHELTFIEADPYWFEKHEQKIKLFWEEFEEKLNNDEYVDSLTERTDLEWQVAALSFQNANAAYSAAKEQLDQAKKQLIELAGDHSAKGFDVSVTKIFTKGSIDKDAIIKEHCPDVDQEPYRKEGRTSYRVTAK